MHPRHLKTESKRRPLGGHSGFTLIELLVVIIILAILAAVVIPRVVGRTEDARRAKALTDIENLGTALNVYFADNGRYPTTEQGLRALREQPTSAPQPRVWNGPYIEKPVPNDPWGSPYAYTSPGQHNPTGFDLISYGADGQPGGSGNDSDLNNWESKGS
ncbi:MAG: type II secretion system major pseudopilin GspG [Armatimonadetes bacterium]|nr:type II secretion system major pseudopilin GspG [Armatimonadota bacterium]